MLHVACLAAVVVGKLVLPYTKILNTFIVLRASLRYLLCDYESRLRRFSVVTCIRLVLNVKKEKKMLSMLGGLDPEAAPSG